MSSRSDEAFPIFSVIYNVFAIPYNFFLGFVLGVLAPIAAVAAMVAGIRLLTGKMPFLSLSQEDEEGERHLSLELVPADQVRELFAEQRQRIETELGDLQSEIRAIIEETRADAQAAVVEDSQEAVAEA